MNYGQTAIGEVRVIANYLGINPWEFESPFVLRKKIMKHIYIYVYDIGDSILVNFILENEVEFESPFVLFICI